MLKRLVIASLALATVGVLATPRLSGAFNLRKYYLTKGVFVGSQALTACAVGYHMASMFEINDPSNLEYNTALGITTDDSGSGPPGSALAKGWVRTGAGASGSGVAGIANCKAYTSSTPPDFGTAAGLKENWTAGAITISPWEAFAQPCDPPAFEHVWCVQDSEED